MLRPLILALALGAPAAAFEPPAPPAAAVTEAGSHQPRCVLRPMAPGCPRARQRQDGGAEEDPPAADTAEAADTSETSTPAPGGVAPVAAPGLPTPGLPAAVTEGDETDLEAREDRCLDSRC